MKIKAQRDSNPRPLDYEASRTLRYNRGQVKAKLSFRQNWQLRDGEQQQQEAAQHVGEDGEAAGPALLVPASFD